MDPETVTTLFLCGDVMLGRGIDQILAHPSSPDLHEGAVHDARLYVRLAERLNGPVPRGVDSDYVWGDALLELERRAPDVRIINLETAVTTSNAWLDKGINYRMHPDNVGVVSVANPDCCVLANNHVLDYGRAGLEETLRTLRAASLQTVGAGGDIMEAATPAVLTVRGERRVLVVALASRSSGVPIDWAATDDRSGVLLLEEQPERTINLIRARIDALRRPGDLLVVSIHWGGNWGYRVLGWQRELAHALVDELDVDVVHGHSSHHPKGLEIYHDRLVLYGCGDFLNDYEGISGHEEYRGNLSLMYFASLSATGKLVELRMVPLRTRRFRLERANLEEASWLRDTLDRYSAPFACHVSMADDLSLACV